MNKAALVLVVLVLSTSLSAQDQNRVVLKLGAGLSALGDPQDGKVTLTLASGAKITVALTDIDIPLMRQISGAAQPSGTSEALVSPSQSSAILTAKCQKEWASDFRMQSYCIDQQKEALTALQRRTMASPEQRTIRTRCSAEWPQDFRMRDYCENQQLEALAKLRR